MQMLAKEPALIVGFLEAVLALAVAFGLDLDAGQVGAIMSVVTASLALLLRQAVVAPATIAQSADVPQTVTGLAGKLVRIAGGGT